jgi:hypothetical protein
MHPRTPAEKSRLHSFKYKLTQVISVPNEESRNADVLRNGGTAPLILKLGTTWSETSGQLHDQVTFKSAENSPQYPTQYGRSTLLWQGATPIIVGRCIGAPARSKTSVTPNVHITL